MEKVVRIAFLAATSTLALGGCGSGDDGTSSGSTGAGGGGSCTVVADTTETSVVAPSGCAVRDRDTSACKASREADGLSGFWLAFSCRVTLAKTTVAGAPMVEAKSDGQPDYESNYFPDGDECHVDYTGGMQNPNSIAAKNYDVMFPETPDTLPAAMDGGVVGIALNGVPIYGNFAAPGDNIFKEVDTFDACGGHPQMNGGYHYHTEPYAISYDDGRLIGVMRDGYPIYGRHDPDGSTPTLDASGGHTGVTTESPTTAVYHYHLNLETSMVPDETAGKMAWFLSTGIYAGTPAACPSCK